MFDRIALGASPQLLDLIYKRGDFLPKKARGAAPAGTGPAKRVSADDAGDQAVRTYCEGVLRRARNDVATCTKGSRGFTLNQVAYGLAPYVALGVLSEREVFAALQDAAEASGLMAEDGQQEVDAKIRRGLDAGRGNTAEKERKFAEIRNEVARRSSGGPQTSSYIPTHNRPASSRPPGPPGPQSAPDEGFDTMPPAGEPDEPAPADAGDVNAGPVRPLGHNGGVYYYLSKAGEIRRLRDQDHKRLQILALFDGDDEWLINHCPARDKEGEIRQGAWAPDLAAKKLIRMAARQGIFDPNTPVRGPGVWRTDQGRLVVHVGNGLATLTADDCHRLAGRGAGLTWESAGQLVDGGLYAATARCKRPADKPESKAAGNKILAGLRLWHYDDPLSTDIMLGQLGAAMLGGAPSWRVHLLLIAQGGSGKTSLMSFLDAALGGMGAYTNDTTEAGLRQALTGETRTLLIDEAEGDEGSQGKVEGVIRLLRLMSSGAGANVMRGSNGGKGQNFQVTGCAIMSAILPPPLKPQDRSRICVINVQRPPSCKDTARAVERAAAATEEARRLAPGLRTRAIAGWPRFIETFALYRAGLIAGGLSGRNADTLATILAGRDLLLQDHVPDPDSIEADLSLFAPFMAKADEAEEEGEGQQCLTHLLTSPLDRWHQGERSTIGELVMDRSNNTLARVGIKLLPVDQGGGLLIANQNVGLSRIFEGSKWSDGRWATALRYLDGAVPYPKTVKFCGAVCRATLIDDKYVPKRKEGHSSEYEE